MAEKPEAEGRSSAVTASPCELPLGITGSFEQTAWQLFVAASCPVGGKLGWETWTEQGCLANPGSPGCATPAGAASEGRRLHGSARAEAIRAGQPHAASATPGPCSPMLTISSVPTPPRALLPFVPKNLIPNAHFCEEVFVSAPEAAFVRSPAPGATLTTLSGQVAYAQPSRQITFPWSSLEIKADWLPAHSVGNAFDCKTKPPTGVYVEEIAGECYALVGIHISSKLLPNWLWATFEPQNSITNPNRCNPDLYSACNDPWGSTPPTSTGQSTDPTPALISLMNQAGLPKELLNYRLVGAQWDFVDFNNQPIPLGNSFIEFNAQVLPKQASCITCHSYAMVSTTANENPNFGNFPGTPPIGFPGPAPLPAEGGGTWVKQDFSWMLGIMPTQ